MDYVPESEAGSWSAQDLKFVAEQLVSSNAEFQPLLRDAVRPICARLQGDLERIFADAKATAAQQLSAANAFADYAAGDIQKLSRLLTVATPEQYAVLYPIVAASPAPPRSRISPGSPPRRHRRSWAPWSAYPSVSAVRTPRSPCCGWVSVRRCCRRLTRPMIRKSSLSSSSAAAHAGLAWMRS